MDQSAIDELATIFMRRADRRAHRCLAGTPQAEEFKDSCAVMDAVDKLVGEPIVGTKIAAKPAPKWSMRRCRRGGFSRVPRKCPGR